MRRRFWPITEPQKARQGAKVLNPEQGYIINKSPPGIHQGEEVAMIIFTDGFKNKNGAGFTLCDDKGNVLERHVFKSHCTNNEAELWGIMYAAVASSLNGVIVTDSKVCCDWIKNMDSNARPDLNSFIRETAHLIKEKLLTLRWLPREQNLAGQINEHGVVDKKRK